MLVEEVWNVGWSPVVAFPNLLLRSRGNGVRFVHSPSV